MVTRSSEEASACQQAGITARNNIKYSATIVFSELYDVHLSARLILITIQRNLIDFVDLVERCRRVLEYFFTVEVPKKKRKPV